MKKILASSPADYGALAAQEIHLCALAYRGFLGLLGLDGDRLRRALAETCESIFKHAPAVVRDELRAVSAAAAISLDNLVLLSARSELLSIWAGWQAGECTSVAVSGQRGVRTARRGRARPRRAELGLAHGDAVFSHPAPPPAGERARLRLAL